MRRTATGVALAVLIVGAIAIGVSASGLQRLRVASTLMSPAVERGDWVLTRDADTVRRGDIVLFRSPLGTAGRAVSA